MEFLPLPVTMITCSIPEATHSSTTYWICGLSTTVNISLGCAFVAGRKRVPRPAAGRTALRTFRCGGFLGSSVMIGIFVQLPGKFDPWAQYLRHTKFVNQPKDCLLQTRNTSRSAGQPASRAGARVPNQVIPA